MYQVSDQTAGWPSSPAPTAAPARKPATRLAAAGATVVLAVRNLDKGEQARADILSRRPGRPAGGLRELDLADLSSVQTFADDLIADGTPARPAGEQRRGDGAAVPDAHRRRLRTAARHQLPRPVRAHRAAAAGPARRAGPGVATMASGMANVGRIAFDDLQWDRRRFVPYLAYGQSKLADLLLPCGWPTSPRPDGWSLTSTASTPASPAPTCRPPAPASAEARTAPVGSGQLADEPVLAGCLDREPNRCCSPPPTRPRPTAATTARTALFGMIGSTQRVRIPRSARRGDAERLWQRRRSCTRRLSSPPSTRPV